MENKIDRLYIIAHSGKRNLKSMTFRYVSKSIFSNCTGDGKSFKYINFRGAHFSKSTFRNAVFKGCDFWGTTFKNCTFNNTIFQDCVFQGCKFKNCKFTGANIQYSAIVNTNLNECKELVLDRTNIILKEYPAESLISTLMEVLEKYKDNSELRKTKVLWISDKKINNLNIYLLKRKYSEIQIADYLGSLTTREIKMLITYGSLNIGLWKYINCGNM